MRVFPKMNTYFFRYPSLEKVLKLSSAIKEKEKEKLL